MTFHFNEFDTPSALEEESRRDESLETLTGCPLSRNIEAACSEPGCANNPAGAQLLTIQTEDCLRKDEVISQAAPIWRRRGEIFQTEPKNRCVM